MPLASDVAPIGSRMIAASELSRSTLRDNDIVMGVSHDRVDGEGSDRWSMAQVNDVMDQILRLCVEQTLDTTHQAHVTAQHPLYSEFAVRYPVVFSRLLCPSFRKHPQNIRTIKQMCMLRHAVEADLMDESSAQAQVSDIALNAVRRAAA